VHVTCPPAGNDSYVLIAELHNVGANPHTVYYPKVDMSHPRRGDYPYLLDLSKAQIGTSRRLYVINVDPSQDILLGQNTVIDNGLLNLPQGTTIVSNPGHQHSRLVVGEAHPGEFPATGILHGRISVVPG
jgi:hypothetical protein